MDVKLVSEDRDLYKLCREILAGVSAHHRAISVVGVDSADTESDIWLWDFHPGMSFPGHAGGCPSRHLFLVHRKDLPAFHEKSQGAEANILLKPVTRAALGTFLGLAVSAYEDRISVASSLRADRDAMLQCLIQTNLRLQEYDQDRTSFLARAVHDFRAPLTAISGYCGLLLGAPLGPLNDSQTEVLQRMQHSAGRLLRMANAMFELSVGRHVKRVPGLQRGDIRVSLDQALHEIAPFSDEKRLSITMELEPHDDRLFFDRGQIEQVFVNILDNACKFTPKS